MYYTCIACITIDFVLKIDKKNHSQVYLEECKYRVKKTQMYRFINTELKADWELSDSELDSEKIEAKIDNKLVEKLKYDSDSVKNILLTRFCWRWTSFVYASIFKEVIF